MGINWAALRKKVSGYVPPAISAFDRIIIDNWEHDPVIVVDTIRSRAEELARIRHLNVDGCTLWTEKMIERLTMRNLSPFAVPHEIDLELKNMWFA